MQGPGALNNIEANTVVIFGPSGTVVGLFEYAIGTTPALGNPPVAWISQSLNDPFGNSLHSLKDIVSLNPATATLAQLTMGQLRIGVTTDFSPAIFSTQSGQVKIASPQGVTTDTPATLEFNSSAVGAGGFPELKIDNGTVIRATSGGVLINDDLHVFDNLEVVKNLTVDINSTLKGNVTAQAGITVTAFGIAVTGGTTTDTLNVTSTSTFGAKETITAGGLAVTGGTTTDTLAVTSTSTLNAKETITAGGLAVTGGITADTLTVNGETTLTPQVTGGHPVIAVTDQTVTGPVTGTANAAVTKSWPIGALDAQPATVYELEAGGYGVQGSTQEALRAQLTFMGVNVGSDTLPSTVIPASAQFEWLYRGSVSVVTNGASGTVRSNGTLAVWEVGGPANAIMVIGQHTGVADSVVNTTIAQTMSLGMSWGATTGAPTVTGGWSVWTRKGP